MISIIVISIFLSGLFEGAMDWLQFRLPYKPSHKLFSSNFWNMANSWKNKWKAGDYTYTIEKFWQSSRALVFLTDGWHLMKWLRNRMRDAYTFTALLMFVNWKIALLLTFGLDFIYGFGFAGGFRFDDLLREVKTLIGKIKTSYTSIKSTIKEKIKKILKKNP